MFRKSAGFMRFFLTESIFSCIQSIFSLRYTCLFIIKSNSRANLWLLNHCGKPRSTNPYTSEPWSQVLDGTDR